MKLLNATCVTFAQAGRKEVESSGPLFGARRVELVYESGCERVVTSSPVTSRFQPPKQSMVPDNIKFGLTWDSF